MCIKFYGFFIVSFHLNISLKVKKQQQQHVGLFDVKRVVITIFKQDFCCVFLFFYMDFSQQISPGKQNNIQRLILQSKNVSVSFFKDDVVDHVCPTT